ncbi:DNA lyase [Trichoderma citrinoviride]|uniref:DNA-(apurinic or apyrimidinic site) endonuclease 2 n=1 Tax=Trichoderma citrinoviride TaxID=58853 RepID=A0A2T4BMI5_9HYPO|nr:DNA lyase [Trichoderma citrinoviride]PTB70490.1 DNA lyase [Trichoderma citrinoviride]
MKTQVNGIRNPFGYQPWREKRTFQAMFDLLEADIVVMQETKIQRKDLTDDMVLVPGWDAYFSLPRHKKGYSGVAIYTRNATCAPIRAEEGILGVLCPPKSSTQFRNLPDDQRIGGYPKPEQLSGNIDELLLDSEGRCVILEFPAFVLLGVYSPANRDESRVEFRMEFLQALDARVRNLVAEGKQVILAGDLNVSRAEADSTNIVENLRKEGLSMDEWMNLPSRRLFNHLVFGGTVQGDRDEGREHPVLWDLCREFHPAREGMNTCWDTKRNTRPANNGSRIDYVLCSHGLKDWVTEANIQEGLMGSDHCPVFATLADVVTAGEEEVSLLSLVNPAGMVDRDGRRLREWHPKDILPLSAKLIPEFDRRQSIRDMFTKKAGAKQSSYSPSLRASEFTPEGEPAGDLARPEQHGSKTKTSHAADHGLGLSDARHSARSESLTHSRAGTKGQTTLQGFFQPSSTKRVTGTRGGSATMSASANTSAPFSCEQTTAALPSEPLVFDPILAKESWSKLLGRRKLPRCEHDEPCISLVTKRPGVNCGRSFYICARPLGPSGEKERGSEWRCGTFIWSSDWNGSPS